MPIDSKVKDLINQQVIDGIINSSEVRRQTELYVKQTLVCRENATL